jgi:DNA-binding SARP family transcriptional activator
VLRIGLLGELSLRLGETSLPALESARAESLLAYLLLHRGSDPLHRTEQSSPRSATNAGSESIIPFG